MVVKGVSVPPDASNWRRAVPPRWQSARPLLRLLLLGRAALGPLLGSPLALLRG
jgi:hypothetical protein